MHALLERRGRDPRRGQADAVIDHLEAAVAGRDRDLLGAVGMAVEAGLADQHLEAPAEPRRERLDPGPDRGELGGGAGAHAGAADPGRRPVVAEHLAQHRGPLAGRRPGAGARRSRAA